MYFPATHGHFVFIVKDAITGNPNAHPGGFSRTPDNLRIKRGKPDLDYF